ncbi:MAG: SMC family ATPase [Leptolyngbya sp.]|nr:SMC family ATPase [Leptolyngbya sp.]
MQILSVSLQNFKAHQDRVFEFQLGTNAICGENGAGKTSILEAIAWVLFNHQGDYAKEDLIRNGSSSAQVTVAFVSNHDSRTYTVQRCTQKGYTLFDPQRDERLPYTRLKDEVLPWLRQHLGVSPTTNLPQLFARTVGVPQGTFTADFLQTAEQRKAVFDAILKVEDYKQAFKQMNTLRRYAEDQVNQVKGQIQQYEDALTQWDELTQRQQGLTQEIQVAEQRLTGLQQDLQTLQTERDAAKAQAQQIQTLTQQIQGLSQQQQGKDRDLDRLQQAVEQAQRAVEICTANRPAYEGYQAAEKALVDLNQRQGQRQTLQGRYQALQTTYGQKQAELARWQTQMEALEQTTRELDALQPLVAQQDQIEAQQRTYQTQRDQLQAVQAQIQGLQQQQQRLEQQQRQVAQAQERLGQWRPAVGEIAALEEQRDRLQQQISRLAAARQFEADIQTLVAHSRQQQQAQSADMQAILADFERLVRSVPLISGEVVQKLQNALQNASDLHGDLLSALDGILRDLSDQTDEATLQRNLTTLTNDLKQRYGWRAELDQEATLKAQAEQLQRDHTALTEQIADLTQQLEQRTMVDAALQDLAIALETLGHPRQKQAILQRTLKDRATVDRTCAQITAQQQEISQQMADLTAQLEGLQSLEADIAAQQTQRRTYQAPYEQYLRHRDLANQCAALKRDLGTTQADLEQIAAQRTDLDRRYAEATATYDPAQATALETRYASLKTEADQLAGSLPQQRQRLADLDQQLAGLTALAAKRDAAQEDLKAREKIKRFVNFARKAYNEAGPRITEQYVRSISVQADRLFRELLNRPDVALEWTRDYDILVQDGPHQRRFVNLSGGEQMCAALAVRLALLKVLADIDIAFFDEPTTNMDKSRRQGLAEAISRIKSFKQLFVISHDDTFESITENVIIVEREG